jgi:Galactose oxidase, central domain
MKKYLIILLSVMLFSACDDSENANTECEPLCNEWETCTDATCILTAGRCENNTDCTDELCNDSHYCESFSCDPTCYSWENCEIGTNDSTPACVTMTDFDWVQFQIVIVDPIVNGTSLNTPTDGISYGYSETDDEFITSFDRDFNNPELTFLWHVNGTNGEHTKKSLTGTVFDATEVFCVSDTQWCQFISYDSLNSEYVVFGSSTDSIMRVNSTYEATLIPVSGTHPPDNFISNSHYFDWNERKMYYYGALGPSGFSDIVFSFDLDTYTWASEVSGLQQIAENCIVNVNNTLYSFGGKITNDGGNTTEITDIYEIINLTTSSSTPYTLPAEIGARKTMSCVYDPNQNFIYLFGGAVVVDRWNEALNTYHNDLWILDLDSNEWTNIIPESTGGTLEPPDTNGDQSFVGYPDGPNFGQNQGKMTFDQSNNRLILLGSVPIFSHEQIYYLDLN